MTSPHGNPIERQLQDQLTGVWQSPDGELIHIKKFENRLLIGFLEFDEKRGQYVAINSEAVLTTNENRTFVFFRIPGESDEFFFFVVSNFTDGIITLRRPDPEVFRQGVKTGTISGKIVDRNLYGNSYQRARLDADEDSFFKFLKEKGLDNCFAKDSEITYRKLEHPQRGSEVRD
ncbi:hypothetical protein DTL42_17870 [Bremerella cremea]|uniref:Uncharacterized protein n=1 Tax=Bremerella cremea TaxID=1031537 RepID=A0A368KMV0_9BACT|nr:hypothetical protein [Bremerella cremea]RCS44179.1 hypothetical protein DTL42_17870 [Bremerella cremea]